MDSIPGRGTKIPQATQNGQKKDTYIKKKKPKTQSRLPVRTILLSTDTSCLLSF